MRARLCVCEWLTICILPSQFHTDVHIMRHSKRDLGWQELFLRDAILALWLRKGTGARERARVFPCEWFSRARLPLSFPLSFLSLSLSLKAVPLWRTGLHSSPTPLLSELIKAISLSLSWQPSTCPHTRHPRRPLFFPGRRRPFPFAATRWRYAPRASNETCRRRLACTLVAEIVECSWTF